MTKCKRYPKKLGYIDSLDEVKKLGGRLLTWEEAHDMVHFKNDGKSWFGN